MIQKRQYLLLPIAAVVMSMLSGCSSMGALLGANQPMLSPGARAAAEMPLEKEPVINTQETYLSLVRQMQAKSLWYASIAHLDALDKQWGASSDSRLMRADALRQVGQLSAATPLYQGLLGSAKDGAARYGLGRVAAENGDFGKAAQQMEQARMSNPVDPQLLTDLGYAYLRARDLNAARTPLMQAAQLNPEDPQINVNLSLFLMVSGQAKEAERFMQQRKLDSATQQAIKEQAGHWFKGVAQAPAVATAAVSPTEVAAAQPTGKVVNLSRPVSEVDANTAVAKTAPGPVAQPQEAVREEPAAKKSVPEPEVAQAPAVAVAVRPVVVPSSVQQASMPVTSNAPQSVAWAPSASKWMVSGGSFDSARPRYPGVISPQVTAYAVPAQVPTPSAPAAAVSVAALVPATVVKTAATVVAVPVARAELGRGVSPKPSAVAVEAPKPVNASVLGPEPASQVVRQPASSPVVPRQPSGPSRTLQDSAVVLAVANPVAVRQVGAANGSQNVQTLLPRRPASAGLYFETPDEPQPAKAASTQTAAPERVWP